MIKMKPLADTKKGKDRRIGVTHAPYAFTGKVIPEAMYGGKPVTKSPKRAVTKSAKKAPVPASGAGRPKVHATSADRQRAYRERKKRKA